MSASRMDEQKKQPEEMTSKRLIVPAEDMVKALVYLGYELSEWDKDKIAGRVNFVINWDGRGTF